MWAAEASKAPTGLCETPRTTQTAAGRVQEGAGSASSVMLVYLPAQRLLYASDAVVPDAFEPVFAAAYWAELASVVKREGLPWSACSPSICRQRHGEIALGSDGVASPASRDAVPNEC